MLKEEELTIRKQEKLREVKKSIRRRDMFLREWNRQSRNIILPSCEWKENDRVVPSFAVWSYVVIFLSILTILPAVLVLPYLVKVQMERRSLKNKIIRELNIINGTPPVPVGKEQFESIKETSLGRKMINSNVVFKSANLAEDYPVL